MERGFRENIIREICPSIITVYEIIYSIRHLIKMLVGIIKGRSLELRFFLLHSK